MALEGMDGLLTTSGVDSMSEYSELQIDQWRAWCQARRDEGFCPHSGLRLHDCHGSICDCFGAEDCTECSEPDVDCSLLCVATEDQITP